MCSVIQPLELLPCFLHAPLSSESIPLLVGTKALLEMIVRKVMTTAYATLTRPAMIHREHGDGKSLVGMNNS